MDLKVLQNTGSIPETDYIFHVYVIQIRPLRNVSLSAGHNWECLPPSLLTSGFCLHFRVYTFIPTKHDQH